MVKTFNNISTNRAMKTIMKMMLKTKMTPIKKMMPKMIIGMNITDITE